MDFFYSVGRESSLELFTAGYRVPPSENSYSHCLSRAHISAVALPWCVVIKHFSMEGLWAGWLSQRPWPLLALYDCCCPEIGHQNTSDKPRDSMTDVPLCVLIVLSWKREWSVNITQLFINLTLMCIGQIMQIDSRVEVSWDWVDVFYTRCVFVNERSCIWLLSFSSGYHDNIMMWCISIINFHVRPSFSCIHIIFFELLMYFLAYFDPLLVITAIRQGKTLLRSVMYFVLVFFVCLFFWVFDDSVKVLLDT